MESDNIETLTDVEAQTETGTWLGTSRHSDADSMRREFGLRSFDPDAFPYESVVPGCLKHARDNSAWSAAGGTDFMGFGAPGAGKSTLGLHWSINLLDINNRPGMQEAVVWRGSESRSEWTPLAPWATVCLPESCDMEVSLASTSDGGSRPVALEDVVREVRRYEDPEDLFANHIEPGKFHVVYPDPAFRGCQDLYERSPKRYDLEFQEGDPVGHWWIAAALARVEYGPFDVFTSFILDEVGDFLSQDASKDTYSTYQKVNLFQDVYVDARKYGVSFFSFGHSRAAVHGKIRRKVRWEITMNGLANPTKDSQVVGDRSVPMNTDLSSSLPTGKGVMWTGTNFCYPFTWSDVPKWTDEELRVSLSVRAPSDPEAAPTGSQSGDPTAREVRSDGGESENTGSSVSLSKFSTTDAPRGTNDESGGDSP